MACSLRTLLHACCGNGALGRLQSELESILFDIMRSKGFGDAYIRCYKVVTQFYQLRQPLVILICGAPWTGGWGGGWMSG